MGIYGTPATWKVTYTPTDSILAGRVGVAFVEGETQQIATYNFKQQYAGQFRVVESVTRFG